MELYERISKVDSTNPYFKKDLNKAKKANKFIGQGSSLSSTNKYMIAADDLANTGNYSSTDIVFVSAEGMRKGRKSVDFAELKIAIDANVTFVTDVVADRERSYNLGERQVAEFFRKEWLQRQWNWNMEEITYQNCDAYIDSCSLSGKIALILKLADGEDNCLYCHAKVKIIMDYECKADINSINEILLASFKIKRTSAKVLMLRGTYSVRRYLKYWHNLRDQVHNEILNSEENHLRMNGLFEEVRNSVDNLWWQLTPHKSYMFGFPMDKFWPEIQWRYYNVNKERNDK